MTLRDLGVGRSGRVLSVGGEKILRHRLLEMGITPRTAITVKKIAPMGDPIELLLRGYVLTLRLDDAEKIVVEEVKCSAGSYCAHCAESTTPDMQAPCTRQDIETHRRLWSRRKQLETLERAERHAHAEHSEHHAHPKHSEHHARDERGDHRER